MKIDLEKNGINIMFIPFFPFLLLALPFLVGSVTIRGEGEIKGGVFL
jgi:hypothetical protein